MISRHPSRFSVHSLPSNPFFCSHMVSLTKASCTLITPHRAYYPRASPPTENVRSFIPLSFQTPGLPLSVQLPALLCLHKTLYIIFHMVFSAMRGSAQPSS